MDKLLFSIAEEVITLGKINAGAAIEMLDVNNSGEIESIRIGDLETKTNNNTAVS